MPYMYFCYLLKGTFPLKISFHPMRLNHVWFHLKQSNLITLWHVQVHLNSWLVYLTATAYLFKATS